MKMLKWLLFPVITGFAVINTAVSILPATAGEKTVLPVPVVTVYPGEVISEKILTRRRFSAMFLARGGYIRDYDGLTGKITRRTLVRGRPIPLNAVRMPYVVKAGQLVRLQYRSSSLLIIAQAVSLKSASVGELVQTRNVDSGRIISGLVQPEGSVRVSKK